MAMNYLSGLTALLAKPGWDFFVNLSGADFPTARQEIVQQLLGQVKGRNFVHWKPRGSWQGFADKRLREFYVDTGLAKIHAEMGDYLNVEGEAIGKETKEVGVRNPIVQAVDFVIAKTSGWFVLSRAFCEHLRGDAGVRKMVALMAYMDASDEHMIGSVLWNSDRWRGSVVDGNLRSIFFVAPNGSFAMGEGGRRTRQHPFWVDERNEEGDWLFWKTLVEHPGFWTRKVRGGTEGAGFREKVEKELMGKGADAWGNECEAYEERLTETFKAMVKDAVNKNGEWSIESEGIVDKGY